MLELKVLKTNSACLQIFTAYKEFHWFISNLEVVGVCIICKTESYILTFIIKIIIETVTPFSVFSFHLGFSWYSSSVINFPYFFSVFFELVKILLFRHSQNNYQLRLNKSNLMCDKQVYQIINTWLSIKLSFATIRRLQKSL